MRTAIYARVSTPFSLKKEEDKQKQKQDIDNQLLPLNEFVSNKKWTLYKIYLDYASGKSTDRPQFKMMMEDAFKAKFDIIVVWKIDRFARSIRDFVNCIFELNQKGIRFIAMTQGIDTDKNNAGGVAFMQMLGVFAEFERSLIRERINASIANRKAKGEPIGRPRVDVEISSILKMLDAGLSIRYIAEVKNIDRNVIMRRLKEYYEKNPKTNTKVQTDFDEEIIIETFQENN